MGEQEAPIQSLGQQSVPLGPLYPQLDAQHQPLLFAPQFEAQPGPWHSLVLPVGLHVTMDDEPSPAHVPQVTGQNAATSPDQEPHPSVLPQLFLRAAQLPLHTLSAWSSSSWHAADVSGTANAMTNTHRMLSVAPAWAQASVRASAALASVRALAWASVAWAGIFY